MDSSTDAGLIRIVLILGNASPAIVSFINVIFVFVGVAYISSGIKGFYDLNKYGTYSSGGYAHKSAGGLIWRMGIGAILTALPFTLGVFGNSLFGTGEQNGPLTYAPGGASALQKAILEAIFNLFAIAGYISFGHGWMSLNAAKSGQNQMTWKAPAVWMVAGVCLIYLPQVLDVMAKLTGLNVMNFLLF